MASLQSFLVNHAEDSLVSWSNQSKAADQYGVTVAEVENVILETGLLPARYYRNQNIITNAQQLQLFRSTVTLIGAGGLGGYILEQLARLGVGQIVLIDHDVFEETNLNRQLLSSPENIGRVKVEVAAERMARINPAVTLRPIRAFFDKANGAELLRDADCVVDAVDKGSTRQAIEATCEELKVPLVHGAIAGWYGQVSTVWPGERSLSKIYQNLQEESGIGHSLGNPSFTPAMVASFEVAEVCKILLGQGRLLRKSLLTFNLLDMEIDEFSLQETASSPPEGEENDAG